MILSVKYIETVNVWHFLNIIFNSDSKNESTASFKNFFLSIGIVKREGTTCALLAQSKLCSILLFKQRLEQTLGPLNQFYLNTLLFILYTIP